MRPQVFVDGVNFDCVSAPDIAINVGRQTIEEGGGPGYCQLVWHDQLTEFGSLVNLADLMGKPVQVSAGGHNRFAGQITDATVEHDRGGVAMVRVTAAGPLSVWGKRFVSDDPMPEETIPARAARIGSAIGETAVVWGGRDVLVAARNTDTGTGQRLSSYWDHDKEESFTALYNYTTPNNWGAPGPGDAVHADKREDVISFHNEDADGTDRLADFEGLQAGDTFTFNGAAYSVVSGIHVGTYTDVAVTPITPQPDGQYTFVFSAPPGATPAPGNVQGDTQDSAILLHHVDSLAVDREAEWGAFMRPGDFFYMRDDVGNATIATIAAINVDAADHWRLTFDESQGVFPSGADAFEITVIHPEEGEGIGNAGTLLRELAVDTGGWVYDHAGVVNLQSIDARAVSEHLERWQDQGVDTWASAVGGWFDQLDPSPDVPVPFYLDPCAVEWAPTWSTKRGDIANVVVLSYGDEEGRDQIVVTDQTSIDKFGRFDTAVDTRLVTAGDATTRASQSLLRRSRPRWRMGGVTVDVDTMPNVDDLLSASPGKQVFIDELPQPAPYQSMVGHIEGWAEVFFTNGAHRLQLFISELAFSAGATLTWATVDPADTWTSAQGTWLEALQEV